MLQNLIQKLGIALVPQWLPSSANCFADHLSRTWNPGDLIVCAHVRLVMLTEYAHLGVAADGTWPTVIWEFIRRR